MFADETEACLADEVEEAFQALVLDRRAPHANRADRAVQRTHGLQRLPDGLDRLWDCAISFIITGFISWGPITLLSDLPVSCR